VITAADELVAFLRLSLPSREVATPEQPHSAMIREVHVYGQLVSLGQSDRKQPQHLGLGRKLIEEATEIARDRGYRNLSVISAIGTREYYRSLGFEDGELYQHRAM
jgi:elongator complex protein 3